MADRIMLRDSVSIYAVICPINFYIVYIGQTNNIGARKRHHRYDTISTFGVWYRVMLDNGHEVEFITIDVAAYHSRLIIEDKWIRYCRSLGNPLLNKEQPLTKKTKHIHLHLDYDLFVELLGMAEEEYSLPNEFIQNLIIKGATAEKAINKGLKFVK